MWLHGSPDESVGDEGDAERHVEDVRQLVLGRLGQLVAHHEEHTARRQSVIQLDRHHAFI